MNTSNASYHSDPRWLAVYLVIGALVLAGLVAVPVWQISHHIERVIDGRVQIYQHHPTPTDRR